MSVRQENRNRRRIIKSGLVETDRQREAEAATMPRGARPPVVKPSPNPSRRQVRSWMRANASDYETATNLAEAANAALPIPQEWMDDETHWIWEEALNAIGAE